MAPTPSEAGDGPTTSSSKSSLLWAYQLRKEHIHLVNRIEDVNSDLQSCSSRVIEQHQNLSNLETVVKTLQADNHTLKNEVTNICDRFTVSLDRTHKQVASVAGGRDIREQSLVKLNGDFERMEHQIREMMHSMLVINMGMVNLQKKSDCLAMKQVELASWQGKMSPPKTPISSTIKKGGKGDLGAGVRSSLVICLRYGRAAQENDKHNHSATERTTVADPQVDDENFSTMADSSITVSMPACISLPIDSIFQDIKQDGRELYDYFAFTAELRSELPRRKQEGHIVEAFFEGLAGDNAVKAAMEEYLDALGWIWSNVECFCRRDQREYNTRSRTRVNKVQRL